MNIKGVMFSSGKCDETVFKEVIREVQAYILVRLAGKSASEPYVLSMQKKRPHQKRSAAF